MPRKTLTREQIVEAAVAVLDSDGLDGLNMRRLGTQLGAAATAMYWHVKSRDDLVVLAGDHVWNEIELASYQDLGWRSAAVALAEGLRAMISRHFWLTSAMSTHLIYGPGKARYDDHCLAVYEAAGFADQAADQATATVMMFVLGAAQAEAAELAWRARLRRDGADESRQVEETVARVTEVAQQFPRLRARIDSPPGQDAFRIGVDTILDGLCLRRDR